MVVGGYILLNMLLYSMLSITLSVITLLETDISKDKSLLLFSFIHVRARTRTRTSVRTRTKTLKKPIFFFWRLSWSLLHHQKEISIRLFCLSHSENGPLCY